MSDPNLITKFFGPPSKPLLQQSPSVVHHRSSTPSTFSPRSLTLNLILILALPIFLSARPLPHPLPSPTYCTSPPQKHLPHSHNSHAYSASKFPSVFPSSASSSPFLSPYQVSKHLKCQSQYYLSWPSFQPATSPLQHSWT